MRLPINIDDVFRGQTVESLSIASYPGPDRSIDLEDLRNGRGVTRRYRNRRIGEFLKELNLTEGRGTGIPKILRAIRKNGSSPPSFETDVDRTYFVARFPIHPKALQRLAKDDMAEASRIDMMICDSENRALGQVLTPHLRSTKKSVPLSISASTISILVPEETFYKGWGIPYTIMKVLKAKNEEKNEEVEANCQG